MKGVAHHHDPKSCVVGREAGGEALTGADADPELSLRNHPSRVSTLLHGREGNGLCNGQPELGFGAPRRGERLRGSYHSLDAVNSRSTKSKTSRGKSRQRAPGNGTEAVPEALNKCRASAGLRPFKPNFSYLTRVLFSSHQFSGVDISRGS